MSKGKRPQRKGSSGKGAGKTTGKGAAKGRGGKGSPPPTRRSSTPGRPPARRGPNRASNRGGNRGGAPDARAKDTTSGVGGDQVEGLHAVREALIAGRRPVHELLVAAEHGDGGALADLADLATQYGVAVREVGRSKLDAVARTTAHQGVVATAAPLPEHEFEDLLTPRRGRPPFLLACDGITDPGNLGALLRTAECAGVTGVVLPRHRSAHVTPAVTKAAAGAVEHLRFAIVGGLPAALKKMSEAGIVSVGLDMGGDVSVHDMPPVDGPVAIVLGAEGRGLGRLVAERCEVLANIPMTGATESLNVSVAGALALYEVVRQRGVG